MADYYEELCPFCENNYLLIYLCEECHAVFCGDCLKETTREELICYNCGRSDLEQNKSGKFYCKNCDSENIISEKRTVPACPNCAESSVVKIIQKAESLKQDFQSVVQNTEAYLKPLEEHVNSLNLIRQELINLRENKLRINHFPQIEMEFLQIIKLFDNIKEATEKKTIDFFDDINRNLKYFAKINQLQPKVLPIVSAIQESLEKNSDDNLSFITESLQRLDERIELLNMKTNFMGSIKSMFMEYFKYIDMSEDEKPVFGLKCKLDTGENKDNEFGSTKGTILLTDKRIYFLHEKGFIRKKTVLLFSVVLDDLETVNVEGTFSKKLTLEFANAMYKFKLNKEKRSQLIDFIEKARVFNGNKIDNDSLETLKHVEISIDTFTESLNDAIFTITGYCTGRFTLDAESSHDISHSDHYHNDTIGSIPSWDGMQVDPSKHREMSNKQLSHHGPESSPRGRYYATNHDRRANQRSSARNIEFPEQGSSRRSSSDYERARPSLRQADPHIGRHDSDYPEHLKYLYDMYAKRPSLHDLEHQNWQYQAMRDQGARVYPKDLRKKKIFNPYAAPDEYYEPHYLPTAVRNQNYPDPRGQAPSRQRQDRYHRQDPMYSGDHGHDLNDMGDQVFNNRSMRGGEQLHDTFKSIRTDKDYSNYGDPYEAHQRQRHMSSINDSIKNRVLSSKLRDTRGQSRDTNRRTRGDSSDTRVYARKKNMRKNRSVLDSLMSIFPEDEEKEEFVPKPRVRKEEFVPKTRIDQRLKPRSYAETLMKLEEREFSLKRTIEMLKLRRKRNKISESEYLDQFQNLQANLFSVQKKIQQVQSRM